MRVKVVSLGVIAAAGASEHRGVAGTVRIQVLAPEVDPEDALVVDELDDVVVDVLVRVPDVESVIVFAVEAVGEDWHQEHLRLRVPRADLVEDEPRRLGDVLRAIAGILMVDVVLEAVVHADHQREVLGRVVAVQRTVLDAPQEVLDAVAADAHADRTIGIRVNLELRFRIGHAPEFGYGIAEKDGIEALPLALRDVGRELLLGRGNATTGMLDRRARFRTVIRARDLRVDRVAERDERSGGED